MFCGEGGIRRAGLKYIESLEEFIRTYEIHYRLGVMEAAMGGVSE